jgi:hypothetical protein
MPGRGYEWSARVSPGFIRGRPTLALFFSSRLTDPPSFRVGRLFVFSGTLTRAITFFQSALKIGKPRYNTSG